MSLRGKALSLSTQEEDKHALVGRHARVIFSRGEENFSARDVVDWALVHGTLSPLWEDFLRSVECDRRAAEQEAEAPGDGVEEAAVEFRYGHNLITAEETERWLEDRGVTLAEFGEYFARKYWSENYNCEIKVPGRAYLAGTTEEKDLFLVHLILSDELDRLAERMSLRLAAQTEHKSPHVFSLRDALITRENIPDLEEWLGQIGRDEKWLDEMLAAEEAFRRQRDSVISETALEQELLSMRLNLTRFELETIEVDSRDAAAEVMACVRTDGMEMREVAEESRYPFRQSEVLLEDLPAKQQQSFLSIKAGALLEPVSREDGFEVCRVKTRSDPTLDDPAVRERLQEQISRRHFSELVSRHIDWKLLQPASEE